MDQTPAPKKHLWRTIAVIVCILLGAINAWISLIAVALAVPGSGQPGAGFTVIALTFVAGNLLSFVFAAFSAWQSKTKIRIIGLVLQVLTLPLCIGIAWAIMGLFGVDKL